MDLELLKLTRALRARTDLPDFYRVIYRDLHWTKDQDGKIRWELAESPVTRHARGHSYDLGRLYKGIASARRGYLEQRRDMNERITRSGTMGNPEMAIDEATAKKWLSTLHVVRVYVFDGEPVAVDTAS